MGDVVKCKVVRIMPFGAFCEIMPNVDGLIHISQIADRRIGKPEDVLSIGEEVEAKITAVDWEANKISLSIRALIAPPVEEKKEAEEAAAEPAAADVEDVPVDIEKYIAENPAEDAVEEAAEDAAEEAAAEEAAENAEEETAENAAEDAE